MPFSEPKPSKGGRIKLPPIVTTPRQKTRVAAAAVVDRKKGEVQRYLSIDCQCQFICLLFQASHHFPDETVSKSVYAFSIIILKCPM